MEVISKLQSIVSAASGAIGATAVLARVACENLNFNASKARCETHDCEE